MNQAKSDAELAATIAEVHQMAGFLVQLAAECGLVLNIEQRPLQPLAMGHYETVVSVRPARSRA
jgi:hypothetical protein